MAPQNRFRVRMICALISATCAVTATAIRVHHHERDPAPSWYRSEDPCDYRIGDRYGHLSVCDLGSPAP
ncbi:hypothetical protein GCM10027176_06220 [Actinoallomurus bryophytorum]|uniref:Uncharacterized protein n=1 Tax=Actinoallomurus bryophytorum TaxID=1490222 RepID=A0A543CNX0_9ACTN|nr:hypothetical protein [Actinoallomurus bryophytorum]TQL98801.1 hypothetical protein FB559_4435 [Actinoallomurus bryophytorum]